jgi:glycosyltransferase involved in cell wall biosynthesis
MSTRGVKPLLSVIVPVTKMAGKMNLLASWTIHTLDLNIEVIIIHDIGDLATGTELKKLIHENSLSNVILIEGRYGSPGFARNAGLEVATGEWFVFWDSDDRPLVNNVMLALSNASASDEIIIGNFNPAMLTSFTFSIGQFNGHFWGVKLKL